jgi:hypothetical protein
MVGVASVTGLPRPAVEVLRLVLTAARRPDGLQCGFGRPFCSINNCTAVEQTLFVGQQFLDCFSLVFMPITRPFLKIEMY